MDLKLKSRKSGYYRFLKTIYVGYDSDNGWDASAYRFNTQYVNVDNPSVIYHENQFLTFEGWPYGNYGDAQGKFSMIESESESIIDIKRFYLNDKRIILCLSHDYTLSGGDVDDDRDVRQDRIMIESRYDNSINKIMKTMPPAIYLEHALENKPMGQILREYASIRKGYEESV